jgi:hypothetical protein
MDLIKRSELPAWLLRKFGSANKLAEELDLTRQTSYNLLTGRTIPNDETCRKLGLDPVFLLEPVERKRQMSTLEQFLANRGLERTGSAEATTLLQERGATFWKELQEATRTTAEKIGRVDDIPLNWDPFPFLKLQYVSATFTPGLFGAGPPRGCRVVFGRIPTAMYIDENKLAAEVWELSLEVFGGELSWSVNRDEIVGVTNSQLAEQIIVRLIQYRDEYHAAHRMH